MFFYFLPLLKVKHEKKIYSTRVRNICQLSVVALAWPRSVEFFGVFHFARYFRTLSVTRPYFSVEWKDGRWMNWKYLEGNDRGPIEIAPQHLTEGTEEKCEKHQPG
jgi:hypothetical protein